MNRISDIERERIVTLRTLGHSIPEIVQLSGSAQTTVQRYSKGVSIPTRFLTSLREKQGGAKERAKGLRLNTREEAQNMLGTLNERDRLLVLAGIYWGEGTKRDFTLINSDPRMIQTFIHCLRSVLHIPDERLSLSLRMHKEVRPARAKAFWSQITGLSQMKITRIETVEGKKKGKLPYGMCRVRVQSGIRDRLIVQSLISLIGKDSAERVVSP